jgi:signal transduction histidine kinase
VTGALTADRGREIRHQLRTRLNHIFGYSEILLEDESRPEIAAELQAIRSQARLILDQLQTHVPAHPAGGCDFDQLQRGITEPLADVIRRVASLTGAVPAGQIKDLLRINIAAAEMLTFAEGGAMADTELRPPSASASDLGATLNTGSILVVDDNEGNREVLCRQLERFGHQVTAAEDGLEALRQMRERSIDLMLLDVMMPGMDGFAVLQEMRKDASIASPSVLIVSAIDEVADVIRCVEAGADDYLTKPFEPLLLNARITAALERKRFRDREQERSRELERANEDLQQFAYMASHDLKEPLRTITSYSQLIERRSKDLDNESQMCLRFIQDAARRMHVLVEDLLAFAKVTRSDTQARAPVDLNEVVRTVRANLDAAIRESGATVHDEPLPPVLGDLQALTQVLQNLVSNSIKYRRPDVTPEIRIYASPCGDQVDIGVADNGLGIEASHTSDIFLPFKRLHGRDIPGTGVGLAVCRNIVERSGGRIWVESAGPDRGSTFHFTAPAVAAGGSSFA